MNHFICTNCSDVDNYDLNYTCNTCGSMVIIVNERTNCESCNGLGVVGVEPESSGCDICYVCNGEGVV